jgi:4-amino-4-deoxy-L-arabinose transferase-like glycosyltransferase
VGAGHSALGWTDLAVIPLIAVLSIPPLVWFGHNWTVIGNDAARYLLAASELVSGAGLQNLSGIPHINHGPGFPALIGSLILLFGRDTESLAWAVRLLAQLNPLLLYFLTRRLSNPLAGLISAALFTLFGFNVETTLNIDSVMLTLYLLALLALLAAIRRESSLLALSSGLLLGGAILTKETALANLPLALLAVLLLGWDVRRALWHYAGIALMCVPWWVWAWKASGGVYLVDRLPIVLQISVVVAGVMLLVLGALAYASGIAARSLADQSRRRQSGWFGALAWTVSLAVLLLATGSSALARLSLGGLNLYLGELLAPAIVVVPVVVLVVGYVIWKVRGGGGGAWKVVGLALLFQVPICMLVTVEGWAPRQFLVAQALLFCAFGALVVEAGREALRGRGRRRLAGVVVAAPLVILILVSSVERVRALVPEDPGGLSGEHTVVPQSSRMIDWMAGNVPEGDSILVTPALDKYLMFLDGERHEWIFLRLDQEPCEPRPNIQIGCDPQQNAISRTPSDAVWVQIEEGCSAISLSMSNLLEQTRRTDSGYVMISGTFKYPGILQLAERLKESGAFEVVHAELDRGGANGATQGVVLLKSTGRAPEAVPTLMDPSTVRALKRCEQAKGPGYQKRVRSGFPNGISEVPD